MLTEQRADSLTGQFSMSQNTPTGEVSTAAAVVVFGIAAPSSRTDRWRRWSWLLYYNRMMVSSSTEEMLYTHARFLLLSSPDVATVGFVARAEEREGGFLLLLLSAKFGG